MNMMTKFHTQIWSKILNMFGTTNITQKQVYFHWAQLNQDMWRLATDQLESAMKVLDREVGKTIEVIPIAKESGISCLAFAFVDVVKEYGKNINEVSIDSTCEYMILSP